MGYENIIVDDEDCVTTISVYFSEGRNCCVYPPGRYH
jgi:hypothetical protein